MEAKTEELLYMLLWTCEFVARPTWRQIEESFEGWAYRKGLLRQLQRLEKRGLIERPAEPAMHRLHRLTQTGIQHARGGRDPEQCWARNWDGRWRVALFDVPEARSAVRDRLRNYLRRSGFGCLQGSVWVTASPAEDERALIAEAGVGVRVLLLLDACPCAGETDAEIVRSAWDFSEINRRYAGYQELLARRPRVHLCNTTDAANLHRWLSEERTAWLDLMTFDPLLPEILLPKGYVGREVWRARMESMAEVGEQIRRFSPG